MAFDVQLAFSDTMLKVQSMKAIIERLDFIKINNFLLNKKCQKMRR
jgi:hypothetical protein